jgi:hypothetical protein
VSSVVGGESEGNLLEAEAVGLEEVSAEEDLWAMEDVPETEDALIWDLDKEPGAGTEELMEIAEEEEELGTESEVAEEIIPTVTGKMPSEKVTIGVPEVVLPSKDEINKILKKAIEEKIAALMSSIDLKEAILATMTPLLKDSVEKVLWEVAPDLVERMLKEMLGGAFESLTKEVEKVIWETVPDLAETIISKEIERIKSEF